MPFLAALAVSIAAWSARTHANADACSPLRARNPDGNYIVPGVLGNIEYSPGLALDAYLQQGSRRRPSVIVIHGGGWTTGSRVAHVGQILELLTEAGYHWFSLDYRLAGPARSVESLADVRAALAFVRCRARELAIDPTELVLLGEDTGAQIAALIAAERPPGVVGAILIGGGYDVHVPPPEAKSVPLLVVHGGADSESPVGRAREYCATVAERQGTCRFVEVAGASHRSENWWPSQWGYKQEIVNWLRALSARAVPAHRARRGSVEKDIVFDARTQLKLDAFAPRGSSPRPAVIVVHGGGWEAGDKVTYVTPLFEPLARAGVAWFSIDYRLTPAATHEDQLEDLRRAIQFVRENHARFDIDPDRLFLLGESASGQMVAQVTTEDRSFAGVISFYGVYDFPSMVTDAGPRSLLVRLFRRTVLDDAAREVLRKYSPLHSARKDMPPVLLVNGTGERLWAQAQTFARRLMELGVPHDVVALEGAPHGLENWEGRPEWTSYKARVVDWILRRSR